MLNHGKYSDLTAEQYELLGRNFIEWSNVEFLLGVLLSRLLFTPEFLGRTYSDEMSGVKLENAVKNALDIHRHRYEARIVSEQLSSEIGALVREAAVHRAFRNKLAHYLWMRSNDQEIFGSRMSGKLPKANGKNDSMKVSIYELREKYQSARDLVAKLKRIVIDALPKIEEKQNLTSLGKGCS
ncbi:MAG: hypothetical protein ACQEQ2_10815 [Pseudomonadota bacterium]